MTEVVILATDGQVTIRTTSDGTYILRIDKAPDDSLEIELARNEFAQVATFMGHVIQWRDNWRA